MTPVPRNGVKYGLWLVVALPSLFTVWLVRRYGVDVPFWDEWTIAELLRQIDDRTISFGAIFAQHNEHRMFVPRSIQLVTALSVGRWDTRVGMWLSQGIVVAMMAGCIALWRRTILERSSVSALVSLGLVALILFSPAQHQNFLWGFQLCFFIPAMCLLTSVIVTSSPATGVGLALAAAAACSTMATFAILPGLLTWPLSAAAIVLARGLPHRDDRLKWCGWAACFVCVLAAYFLPYEAPARTPSVWLALTAPRTLLAGVAACMGGFLSIGAQPLRTAMIAGGIVIAVFISLLIAVWRRRSDASLVASSAPWIVMGSFGFLTAVAISIGRVGYGFVAMLESRYTSLTAWTLISIVMINAILRERGEIIAAFRTWPAVALTTLAVSAVGFPHHLGSIRRAYNERLQSLAVYTFAEVADQATPMLPPWVAWPPFRQELIRLEQHGWRKARPKEPTWVNRQIQCGTGVVEFQVTAGSRTMAGGWAYFPELARPADAVLVTAGAGPSRRIKAVQPPLIGRRDVGDAFDRDEALVTGWTLEVRNAPPGETLEFWALDVTSLRAYPLCQEGRTAIFSLRSNASRSTETIRSAAWPSP